MPLPTVALMPFPPPLPLGGVPGGRARKPRSAAIFCCSFLAISSRSGGPSLFFFPHWGSFGGIGNEFGRGGDDSKVGGIARLSSRRGQGIVPDGLGQRAAK